MVFLLIFYWEGVKNLLLNEKINNGFIILKSSMNKLVLDNGAHLAKSGFATDKTPK